jgi:hypothetical protein
MDIVAAIAIGKSLVELAQEIGKIVERAQQAPEVTRRALLYLEAAQASVDLLGYERQGILTNALKCNVGDPAEVDALWTRLDVYIHDDHVRPQLVKTINGLRTCREPLKQEAEVAFFGRKDKHNAVEQYLAILDELESTLQTLSNNFYPGGSGIGIATLLPIRTLVGEIRKAGRTRHLDESETTKLEHELSELVSKARSNPTNREWMETTGRVEGLIVDLTLAFSIKVTAKGPV